MCSPAAGAAQLCDKQSSSDLEPPTLPKPSYLVFLSISLTFKEEWINFLSRNVLATIRTCVYHPEKKTCQENNFRRGGNDSLLNYTLKNGKFIPADYLKQIIQSPSGSTVKRGALGLFCWNRILLPWALGESVNWD